MEEIEQYSFGPYGPFVSSKDYQQALAEKDREITHLQDVYTKQRHKREDDYQQLMEQAVKIAEAFEIIANDHGRTCIEVQKFLNSPEVQAWKEQQK